MTYQPTGPAARPAAHRRAPPERHADSAHRLHRPAHGAVQRAGLATAGVAEELMDARLAEVSGGEHTQPRGRGQRHSPRRGAEGAEVPLARLQLTIPRRLDGLLQGDYLGLLPGPGSEAGESREYRP